ncbi:metalloregulator ArsR/SmtB family transcription factor [Geothrix sp. PMB-07]|uniref:ArsR/SmtB family transcription factor n=1 Tax=Geothrix sp. PMB-07 TaxID=3068640 RepID=UPI0027421F6A|nr:metalloregulator ArsR/SmtB family transcription factor [Geothrix sp. PMB-07]WLT31379.1 metalloregulator ArsR/SmtB family transcription factor [Geothrix sp. PMB-07]
MTTDTLRPLVDTLKVLAHPVRLRILALLQGGELCVCEVAEVLGLASSTVSEHLTGLRRTGLVRERKVGRWVHVALSEVATARPMLEALWPLMAAAESDLARDRARAQSARRALCDLDTCDPEACPGPPA